MSNWSINVPTPASSGENYYANINTRGLKVKVNEVTYPTATTCNIDCTEDSNGDARLSVKLDYVYNPNADPVTVTFTALLDGEGKGSSSTDVQDD